jgi:hypothetical protein
MPIFADSIAALVQPLRLDAAALLYDGAALVFMVGLLLAHGAAAVFVGRGSASGKLWKGVIQGALTLVPAYGIAWFWHQNGIQLVPALASLGYGALLTYMAQTRILDTIVPPEIRDQVRRERRRELRKGNA